MPIYAYRCDACGFQKDVLQKLSEPALTRCPSCEAESFVKQLSAPAFQLKGTGWYVTDFRDNGKKADGKADAGKGGEPAATGSDGADKATSTKPEAATGGSEGTATSSSAAPAATPPKAGSAAGASAGTA
ncbi:MAG: zinc ribbon domain-containing protein [Burkholderiaceae bacterium]|nr:zinc ribbon domain-containing protein [Burkholderiaceae bacterium]